MALSACTQAQQYVIRSYRQAEGLMNLTANALAADRNGFLWVATENGVYRLLGSGFQRFGPEQGIADLNVRALVSGPRDTVWAGTALNLYRWDGQRFVPAGARPIHIFESNNLTIEDEHHLLIVEKSRLYRLEHDDSGRMLSYLPVFPERTVAANPQLAKISNVSVVREAPDRLTVWIGCGRGLCSFVDWQNGARAQPAVTAWGRAEGLESDIWEGVLLDRAGTLWAAGRYHVAALPPDAVRFQRREIPGASPGNRYGHAPMIEDRAGRILAPFEDGLARWDGSSWRIIGAKNGLDVSGYIRGLALDKNGDLWLASRGDGLFSWAGYEDWEGWKDARSISSAMIWTVIPGPGGRILVGTDKGPAWIDPRTGASGPMFAMRRWPFGQVDALGVNGDGSLWAGTFSTAVLRIDPRTGVTTQTARLPSFITRAVETSSGQVFFTTDNGIYARSSIRPAQVPERVKEVDPFLRISKQVDAGCESPGGTVWFLANNRLLSLAAGQWTMPPVDSLSPLAGPLLDLSCAPDGTLWVTGPQAGTWRLTPGSNRIDAWQLQVPQEWRTLAPLAVVADGRGWVWLGTDLGLLAWNGHAWRHVTEQTGLIWNDVNQGAMMAAADGSLWIGTSGGVAHLLHPESVFDSVPLDILLTGIERGRNFNPQARAIVLPWSAQPLEFQISSSAMRNRSELIFRYRMEGLHTDWIESHDGRAVFSGLPPGSYTFVAMAYNPGLNAFSPTQKVDVVILPPWWRSNWFEGICGVVLMLLLAAIDRLRARHMRARSRRLETMVRERTLQLEERTAELEISREQLRVQACHDGLTGLLNHLAILQAFASEMARAQRENRTLILAMADLDHFKRVNDLYGHLAGDEALRTFSGALGNAMRVYDHAGRYGGEEFLLVLTEIPREAVEERLNTLHESISNLSVRVDDIAFKITCSMGATVFYPAENVVTAEALLSIADRALYAAKNRGRNCVVLRDSIESVTGRERRSRPLSTLV